MSTNDTPEIHPLTRFAGANAWRLALQHRSKDHLMIRLTRGNGNAVIRANRHSLTQQSTLFLTAGTLFSITLGPQSIGTILRLPVSADIALPETSHVLRTANLQEQGALTRLLDAMQREQDAGGVYHGEAARAHATLVAIWLRRALLEQPPHPAPGADARLASSFADIVARDYRSNRPMAAHADALGVTATHLSRSCKSACGLSAADILTETSLHSARSLLADSSFPIGRIATHLGFRSAAYFSRFIVKHTGKSPSELRTAARAGIDKQIDKTS